MKTFLSQEKDNISKHAFISLCDGNEKQMRKIFDELTACVGREPVAVEQLCISDLPKDIKKEYTALFVLEFLKAISPIFTIKSTLF
jgi:hypothetical protein